MDINIVNALGSVAMAVFAGVQIGREVRRRKELVSATDSRISSHAYLLLRQLRSWLNPTPGKRPSLKDWHLAATSRGSLKTELDAAENRIMALASFAPDGSPAVCAGVREATALLMSGADHLLRYSAQEPPTDTFELSDWVDLLTNAATELDDCRKLLEQKLVHRDILSAELVLKEKRQVRNPSLESLIHGAVKETRRDTSRQERLGGGAEYP